jgi:hypothetical protein
MRFFIKDLICIDFLFDIGTAEGGLAKLGVFTRFYLFFLLKRVKHAE